ncbi:hypothetical protein ACFQ1X_16245 [Metaplanococcus flavidus]|uniref:Uncharacterized protein n=1 Tax=Metaplanococcus flavidus TaxID=569883 RepID=A0ABW3LGV5_9BACL
MILSILFLQACGVSDEKDYEVSWGDYSDSAVERLEENNIDYEVRNQVIFIKEKDLNKAQDCCS